MSQYFVSCSHLVIKEYNFETYSIRTVVSDVIVIDTVGSELTSMLTSKLNAHSRRCHDGVGGLSGLERPHLNWNHDHWPHKVTTSIKVAAIKDGPK